MYKPCSIDASLVIRVYTTFITVKNQEHWVSNLAFTSWYGDFKFVKIIQFQYIQFWVTFCGIVQPITSCYNSQYFILQNR